MKMKYFAIPLAVMWAVLMILGMLGFDKHPYADDERIIMPVFALFIVLITLLIVSFFREQKYINKRQRLANKEKKQDIKTDKGYLLLEERARNPVIFYILGLIFVLISPFFKGQYWGGAVIYFMMAANFTVVIYNLMTWTKGKKVSKKNIFIAFFISILLLITLVTYFPNY